MSTLARRISNATPFLAILKRPFEPHVHTLCVIHSVHTQTHTVARKAHKYFVQFIYLLYTVVLSSAFDVGRWGIYDGKDDRFCGLFYAHPHRSIIQRKKQHIGILIN